MTVEQTLSPFAPDLAVLEQVAPGVHAFIQPDGGWCLSNAGLIGDGDPDAPLLLVDTAATRSRAERLRAEVLRVAGRMPTLLVNTHFHGDHVFGNCVFVPEATVIGHRAIRDQIVESGLSLMGLWPAVEWGELEVVAPSVTFDGDAVVHVGGMEVHLIHLAGAHTPDDLVVWLPAQRVLFTGDVAMSGVTPFCLMGSVQGCREGIARLQALDPAIVVPGHGPTGGPEVLADTHAYLSWLSDVAAEGVQAGRPPLEQARRTDLGDFAELIDAERLVGNLHRAYHDLTTDERAGRIDIEAPFMEMVAWNGGLPPCHA